MRFGHAANQAYVSLLQRQPLWHTLSLGFAVAGVATLAPSSTAHCAGVTGEHVSTLPVRSYHAIHMTRNSVTEHQFVAAVVCAFRRIQLVL